MALAPEAELSGHLILRATIDYATIEFIGYNQNEYDKYNVYVLNRKNINPKSTAKTNSSRTPQTQSSEESSDDEIKIGFEIAPQFQGGDVTSFQKWVENQLPPSRKQGGGCYPLFCRGKRWNIIQFQGNPISGPIHDREDFHCFEKIATVDTGQINNKCVRTQNAIAVAFKSPQ